MKGKTKHQEKRFNRCLRAAKDALDSINMPFHLHAGTALGAWREHTFIAHDHDLDLGIMAEDADTIEDEDEIIYTMELYGFTLMGEEGTLSRGKELMFKYKNGVPLDIFWVYKGDYKGKKIRWVSSSYGMCDTLPYGLCVWGYRRYRPVRIRFLGEMYYVVPKKTLVDMYGKDWKTPKKFSYEEGVEREEYKGLLRDYFYQDYRQ